MDQLAGMAKQISTMAAEVIVEKMKEMTLVLEFVNRTLGSPKRQWDVPDGCRTA